MFESLRKHSQSLMMIVAIASLATMFSFGFGNTQRGCSSASLKVKHIARVYGTTITEQDFQSLARRVHIRDGRNKTLLHQAVVNGLIERELLAHKAEELGFKISDEELERQIQSGFSYVTLGMREKIQMGQQELANIGIFNNLSSQEFSAYVSVNKDTGDITFDNKAFEEWVANVFNQTPKDYRRVLERELLAEHIRQMVISNVRVSEEEAWQSFSALTESTAINYILFSPDFYELTVADDAAAMDAWAAAHSADVQKAWEARKDSLKKLPRQVRLQRFFLSFPSSATDADKIKVRARAQAILTRLQTPDADFTRTARLYSEDLPSWKRGGETDWTEEETLTPAPLKDAVKPLLPNQLSGLVEDSSGIYIVQLLGRRTEVSEADAKKEIARELYRRAKGEELAVQAADKAQKLLAQPGATLDKIATTMNQEALNAFFHGTQPSPETLADGTTLTAIPRTDLTAPDVKESGPLYRSSRLAMTPGSEALVHAAFGLTTEKPFVDAPFVVANVRYVIALKDGGRKAADRAEFDKIKQNMLNSQIMMRQREAIVDYVNMLRDEASKANELKMGNSEFLAAEPKAAAPKPAPAH